MSEKENETTEKNVEEETVQTPTHDPSQEGSQGGTPDEGVAEEERKPVNLNELDEFRQYQASMDKKLTEKDKQLQELQQTVEAMKAGKEYDMSRYEELAQKIEQQEAVERKKQSLKRSWGHVPGFEEAVAGASDMDELNAASYEFLNKQLVKQEADKVDTEERKKKAESGVDETPSSETAEPEEVNVSERMQEWRQLARKRPAERKGRNPLQEYLQETDPNQQTTGQSSKV